MKNQATMPITPGGIQLLMFNEEQRRMMYGELMLPIIPVMLVHPYPRLLTLVGNSYAT